MGNDDVTGGCGHPLTPGKTMKRWIQIDGMQYLIRGPYKARQVRDRYAGFRAKYPGCKLTWAQWAVRYGAVYFASRR